MPKFIGRQAELSKLLEFTQKKSASFIVVRGRRRIGKSRLLEEFGTHFDNCFILTGIAPEEGVTAAHQLDIFTRQMAKQFKTPHARYDDWINAFWAVAQQVQTGRILLILDEISWMGSKDPTFLGKLKMAWDLHLKKNDKLIFIVCGSASAWIEENILSSTGFVGRISFTMTLEELPLADCNKFWPQNISAHEKLKILSVTGGIPKYLEEINTKISAEENIRRLCFTRGGFLVEEFNQIFSNLFLRDSLFYKKIITALVTGPKERNDICKVLNVTPSGRVSEYLAELELSGFITRDYAWDLHSGIDSKLSQYRLSDNYLRFYLKYINKNLSKINRNTYNQKSLMSLPEWHTIMGLQFENLMYNNRDLIHRALVLKPEEIISANPFFQNKTKNTRGCQIDYLIQAKFDTLYVCEFKFSKNPVDASVIKDVQKKIDALKPLGRYSFRPVLVHVNGVAQEAVESDYFAAIIDLSKIFERS